MKQTLTVERVRVKESLRMTSKKPKRGVLVRYTFNCHLPLPSQAGHAGQHRCTGGNCHHGPHGPHHRHSKGKLGHRHIQPRFNLQSVETGISESAVFSAIC